MVGDKTENAKILIKISQVERIYRSGCYIGTLFELGQGMVICDIHVEFHNMLKSVAGRVLTSNV